MESDNENSECIEPKGVYKVRCRQEQGAKKPFNRLPLSACEPRMNFEM